jgi:hypothetical protein
MIVIESEHWSFGAKTDRQNLLVQESQGDFLAVRGGEKSGTN